MNVKDFLKEIGSDFYTGVPDSQLRSLCNYVADTYGISRQHMIAANEGNCTALAAGYYLATGKIPLVYMQNSGIGNIINPVASLLNENVYGIPCVFVIGWRGEPEVPDEPQHIFQGQISEKLLKDIGIHTIILNKDTTIGQLKSEMEKGKELLKKEKAIAFLVRKKALDSDKYVEISCAYSIVREKAIKQIVEVAKEDIIVSTTGKTSRELFEIRELNQQSHKYDFLTVGSMGHCSSIALGIALNKPNTKVWCIDGDGAVLMHMGAMALIGSQGPGNMIHVVMNNEAHESVGGMPTVASKIDLTKIAKGCGYENVSSVNDYEELKIQLNLAKNLHQLSFIEVKCAIGSRPDVGRPTVSPVKNNEEVMKYLKVLV